MHPTEILDYYRNIEIDRMLNPGRKIILAVNHHDVAEENPPPHNIKKIYPPVLQDESGMYVCSICKDNEQPDMIDYRYNNTAVFLTLSRLRHHYSRFHKQLIKVLVIAGDK